MAAFQSNDGFFQSNYEEENSNFTQQQLVTFTYITNFINNFDKYVLF